MIPPSTRSLSDPSSFIPLTTRYPWLWYADHPVAVSLHLPDYFILNVRTRAWRHSCSTGSSFPRGIQVCKESGFHVRSGRNYQLIYSQTPTFNAWPVVQAALEAVRRGILVEIYADLGFNDEVGLNTYTADQEGELLPFQGGTNEMISTQMYGSLEDTEKDRLKIYWYTGKDQKTPLNASHKSRNCHVKLMSE